MGDDEAAENHIRQESLDESGIEALRPGTGDGHLPADDHGHSDDCPERVDGERSEQVDLGLREIRDHGTYYMRLSLGSLVEDGSLLFCLPDETLNQWKFILL